MENKIIDAKCGISIDGNVVGTICMQENMYLTLVEVEGIPNFFLTDFDCFEDCIQEKVQEDHYIANINEIDLTDYECMFENLQTNTDLMGLYIRYLVCIVRMDFEEMMDFMKETVGKNILEINIPTTDFEE